MHARTAVLASTAVMLFLGACAHPHPREYLTASEQQLGLFEGWYGTDHRVFHSALLYPHGRGLTVNGYLVGIEKGAQEKVGGAGSHPEVLVTVSDDGTDARFNAIRARLTGNRKAHIITHVLRYTTTTRAGGQGRMAQCALYSALDRLADARSAGDAAGRLFDRCPPPAPPPAAIAPGMAFATSWRAVETLRQSMASDLHNASPGYTDILVYVMGWNTAQDEALENFNSLVGHLLDEADARRADFRPLVIGVTWPSLWSLGEWSFVPTSIVRLLSFMNKAEDAEEVGATWLQEVVERAVLPAREEARRGSGGTERPRPRVVLVGHSFGARALVAAITQRTQLQAPSSESGPAGRLDAGDRVVLLEGAFEIERLFDGAARTPGGGAGGEVTRLPDFPAGRPRLTLTASVFDSAVTAAVWGWYAGDVGTYDHLCRAAQGGQTWQGFEFSPFGCGSARKLTGDHPYGIGLCKDSGRTGVDVPLAGKRIRYFDASDLINCDAPFTGGGAHSDIYRRETARFILEEILSPP